jgi:hypothetical protein
VVHLDSADLESAMVISYLEHYARSSHDRPTMLADEFGVSKFVAEILVVARESERHAGRHRVAGRRWTALLLRSVPQRREITTVPLKRVSIDPQIARQPFVPPQ